MKKYLLLLAIAIVGFAACEKQNGGENGSGNGTGTGDDDTGETVVINGIIQIKDPNFLKALLVVKDMTIVGKHIHQDIDRNRDGKISVEEAKQVTRLQLGKNYDKDQETNEPLYSDLRNIDEIRYFTSLKELKCDDNQLISLDLSKNTALEYLNCSNNYLTSLNLDKNTSLKMLGCGGNQWTTLDLSNHLSLEHVYCDSKDLELNLSGCTALEKVSCGVKALDVSGCTALTKLNCSGHYHNNKLASLDVSGCTVLTGLNCNSNDLTTLNLSGCTALTKLYCSSNKLASLDISNNAALYEYLEVESNPLETVTILSIQQNAPLMYYLKRYYPNIEIIVK